MSTFCAIIEIIFTLCVNIEEENWHFESIICTGSDNYKQFKVKLLKDWLKRIFWLMGVLAIKHYIGNWWKGKPSGSIACTRKHTYYVIWCEKTVQTSVGRPADGVWGVLS